MLKQGNRAAQYKNNGRAERFMVDLRKKCLDRLRLNRGDLLNKRRQIDMVIKETCTELSNEEIDSDMIERLRIELLQEEFLDIQEFEVARDMDMLESMSSSQSLMCPLCLKSPAMLRHGRLHCNSNTCGFECTFSSDMMPAESQLHEWFSALFTNHCQSGCVGIPRAQQTQSLTVSCSLCGYHATF
ncbi:unnamed protein product, partial [Mesorhabditis belari]|uniref:RPA-interacting protein C-terminal domain-containing protein n=1 Tax=Mesorhabditis belari TaxID=2138241 RepID=A0AAF3ESD4_9BILA